MKLTKEIGKLADKNGYYYKILSDGNGYLHQPFKPCISGQRLMTEVEANALADWIIMQQSKTLNPAQQAEKASLESQLNALICPNCGGIVSMSAERYKLTAGQQAALNALQKQRLTVEKVIEICAGLT